MAVSVEKIEQDVLEDLIAQREQRKQASPVDDSAEPIEQSVLQDLIVQREQRKQPTPDILEDLEHQRRLRNGDYDLNTLPGAFQAAAGVAEVAGSMMSGLFASAPAAVGGYLAAKKDLGEGFQDPGRTFTERFREWQEYGTYVPKTQKGRKYSKKIAGLYNEYMEEKFHGWLEEQVSEHVLTKGASGLSPEEAVLYRAYGELGLYVLFGGILRGAGMGVKAPFKRAPRANERIVDLDAMEGEYIPGQRPQAAIGNRTGATIEGETAQKKLPAPDDEVIRKSVVAAADEGYTRAELLKVAEGAKTAEQARQRLEDFAARSRRSRSDATATGEGKPAPVGVQAGARRAKTQERLNGLLETAMQRFKMEQQGQAILDNLIDNNISPVDVSARFWSDTFPALNPKTQGKFTRQLKGMGFEPGDVASVNAAGHATKLKDWSDVARFVQDDLPRTAEYLEGTQRGYVSLMRWATEQQNALDTSVSTARGTEINVVELVVEARDLITSSDKAYNQKLQPRERGGRKASDAQITDIAVNLNPRRLGSSAEADRGAPIVGPDMMVESGNGRVLALRKVYQSLPGKAAEYRDFLESRGVDVNRYDQPILVRERNTPLSEAQREQFVVEANESSTARMARAEQARTDANLLDEALLSALTPDQDIGAMGNSSFVRSFLSKLPTSEQNALLTASGELSAEGVVRIEGAVLAKAYGGSEWANSTLARLLESRDNNVRSVSGAMLDAAGDFAKLRQSVTDGKVAEQFDISTDIVQAIERTSAARSKGSRIGEVLSQGGLFDEIPPISRELIKAFYNKDLTRAASRQHISGVLKGYAKAASNQRLDQGDMFGASKVRPIDLVENAARVSKAQADMFANRQAGAVDPEVFVEAVEKILQPGIITAKTAAGIAHALARQVGFKHVTDIRKLRSPTAKMLADRIMPLEDSKIPLGGGYHELISTKQGEYNTRIENILAPLRKHVATKNAAKSLRFIALPKRINDALFRGLDTGKIPESLVKELRALRAVFNDLLEYQREAGVIIGERPNYMKHLWDHKKIHRLEMGKKMGGKYKKWLMKKKGFSSEAADRTIAKILHEEGFLEFAEEVGGRLRKGQDYRTWRAQGVAGYESKPSFIKRRMIETTFDEAKEFLVTDLEALLHSYINRAVEKAEYTRIAGPGEGKLNKTVRQIIEEEQFIANKQGTHVSSPHEMAQQIYNMFDAMQRRYRQINNQAVRRASKAAAGYEVMVHLGWVVFAQLPETMMSAARFRMATTSKHLQGTPLERVPIPLKSYAKAMVDALHNSLSSIDVTLTGKRHIPKSEIRQHLERIGVAAVSALDSSANRFAGPTGVVTNRFIRAVFLEWYTDFQRTIGYDTIQSMVRENARALANGSVKGKKKRMYEQELVELGITPEEAIQWYRDGMPKGHPLESKLDIALVRGINATTIKPEAANQPILYNDPRFQLPLEFTRFFSVFGNTVLKTLGKKLVSKDVTNVRKISILISGAIMPVAIAYYTQFLREAVTGYSYRDKDDPMRIVDAWDRSGLTAQFTRLYPLFSEYKYAQGSQHLANLLGGPLGSDVAKGYEAAKQAFQKGDMKPAARWMAKMTPVANMTPASRKVIEKFYLELMD